MYESDCMLKSREKTEILDDVFLENLEREIKEKYPYDTIKNEDNKKELEDTIEILNDKFEELSIASLNLEDTIELLKTDIFTFNSSSEDIEILDEEIEDFKIPSKSLKNTLELLNVIKLEEPIHVRKRFKPKLIPWFLLLTVCLVVIGIASYKTFFWKHDSVKTNEQIENIVNTTTTKDIFIKSEDIVGASVEDDRYFNYLDVDFEKLKIENSDVVGWIKVNSTNINYPFVQTTDNDFYLKHSFNKTYNSAGWVFADFRNSFYELDKNTIIYAHGRLDNTMFGSLKQVVNRDWYQNDDNSFIQMSTLDNNYIFKVFSVYTIEPETYYITPNFDNDEAYRTFLNILTSRSVYNFNVEVSVSDKILTLSSCYNDSLRVVLHAKIVNSTKK